MHGYAPLGEPSAPTVGIWPLSAGSQLAQAQYHYGGPGGRSDGSQFVVQTPYGSVGMLGGNPEKKLARMLKRQARLDRRGWGIFLKRRRAKIAAALSDCARVSRIMRRFVSSVRGLASTKMPELRRH